VACGDIQGSFHESATKVGATAGIMAEATKLFAHKIDFSRDIKPGDDFCLVFDRKVTESGRTIEAGDLQYAELNGVKFYEFTRADGKAQFFDEAGKNIKGFLLRTPVDGARITSGFGFRRHPILGYNKMHQGIDFGAGSGTPVLAAGDGVVEMAGRFGGYGNWVKVRHSGGYSTGYAHLSRYARGLRPGHLRHRAILRPRASPRRDRDARAGPGRRAPSLALTVTVTVALRQLPGNLKPRFKFKLARPGAAGSGEPPASGASAGARPGGPRPRASAGQGHGSLRPRASGPGCSHGR
jgi:hypothetical protein